MKDCRIRHLPVVEGRPGDEGTLVGVLSSRDVLGASDNATVAEVMTRSPVTVRPEHPLASACERMLSGRFSCLPVLNDQRLIGVFTGTDALRFAVTALDDEGRALGREPQVAQLMTARPLVLVSPNEQLRSAWTMMCTARVRHAPVMSGDLIIGMLSDRDALAAGRTWLTEKTPDRAVLVADAMSTRVSIMPAEGLARDAAKILLHRRVGALAVVRGKALVGILTVSDFMHWILARA